MGYIVRVWLGLGFGLELGLNLELGLVDIARHCDGHHRHVLFSRTLSSVMMNSACSNLITVHVSWKVSH